MAWAVVAYAGSFSGAFVFDDTRAILANPSIRGLWPPGRIFLPPPQMTTSGRPLVNASFALNYAAGRFHVEGYHAVNLAIHVLAGLALAGLVRRTAQWVGLRRLTPEQAGFGAALLWLVHPLQTESVTYIVQRAESLAGLLYLATLYCFVRGAQGRAPHSEASVTPMQAPAGETNSISSRPPGGAWLEPWSLAAGHARGWLLLSVACCWLGMAAKETVATAPILTLLFDRTFVAGSFGEAWRRRRTYYLTLGASWSMLAVLVVSNGGRGGSVGAAAGSVWLRYALTQGWAVLRYLRLCLWPAPLVFDYGRAVANGFGEIALPILLVALLLALTVSGLTNAKWRGAGFLGAWFFLILAPSSSVVPIVTETAAEHRMYLPLAAVAVAAIFLIDRIRFRPLALILPWVLAAALTAGTLSRNRDYRDPVRLWQSSVDAFPNNPRAWGNLAEAEADAGHYAEAIANYRHAAEGSPDNGRIWFDFGATELAAGNAPAAVSALDRAVRLLPGSEPAELDLGVALAQSGRAAEALPHFRRAVDLAPSDPQARANLARALRAAGATASYRGPATPP